MRIVVLVKYVPDRGIRGLLSELDEYPLEAARRLAETAGAEVIAVSVGPPRAGDALRRALQLGAHAAVL